MRRKTRTFWSVWLIKNGASCAAWPDGKVRHNSSVPPLTRTWNPDADTDAAVKRHRLIFVFVYKGTSNRAPIVYRNFQVFPEALPVLRRTGYDSRIDEQSDLFGSVRCPLRVTSTLPSAGRRSRADEGRMEPKTCSGTEQTATRLNAKARAPGTQPTPTSRSVGFGSSNQAVVLRGLTRCLPSWSDF